MVDNAIALRVEGPDFGNSFSKGYGQAQDRQMNSMKMDMAQKEQGRQEALQMMEMLGSAGMYALDGKIDGQADPAKWDEAMDGLSQFGFDAAKYKGKPEMAAALVGASLSTSDRIKMAKDDRDFELSLRKFDADLAQNAQSLGLRREALDLQKQRGVGGKAPSGYRTTEDGNLEFIPGGPADPKNKPTQRKQLTEGQAKTAGYTNRMVKAEDLLSTPGEDGSTIDKADPGKASLNPFSSDFYEALNRKHGPNITQSEDYQKFVNGAQEWIRAKLRKESGAAISASEWDSEFKTYFPQPGDKPANIKQKAQLRANAVESMKAEARGGYDELFGSGNNSNVEAPTIENMTDEQLNALDDAQLEALVNGE